MFHIFEQSTRFGNADVVIQRFDGQSGVFVEGVPQRVACAANNLDLLGGHGPRGSDRSEQATAGDDLVRRISPLKQACTRVQTLFSFGPLWFPDLGSNQRPTE